MEYEARITECHLSTEAKPTYNVQLASFDKRGNGVLGGNSRFNVNLDRATEAANKMVRIYGATLINEGESS